MRLATTGNLRVAAAAVNSYGEAMQLGYRTGTVTGMLTDGLGLLGGTVIFLIFGVQAYEALLGFGFGGTLLALFMRVGGGIYTKAADVGADLGDADWAIFQSAIRSGVLRGGGLAGAQLIDGNLAHAKLLHLAGDGHGELTDHLPVPRDLLRRNLARAERLELLGGADVLRAVTNAYPCHHLFAVLRARDADHLRLANRRMGVELARPRADTRSLRRGAGQGELQKLSVVQSGFRHTTAH